MNNVKLILASIRTLTLSVIIAICLIVYPAFAIDAPILSVSSSSLDLSLSWPSVADATGYTLHYAPYPYQGEHTIIHADMGTATEFSITLWDGAAYYVAVTSLSSVTNEKSSYSNIELFSIDATTPPVDVNSALLAAADTWMYQIQGLDEDGVVDILAASNYPLLVIEPGHNFSDSKYHTTAMVSALRQTPDGQLRLLLAYIDIGQAEDYRNYWGADWVAPTAHEPGTPDFLVTIDPDGWSGNYPVAYWRQEWKNIWLGDQGIIATLAAFGFDGIYLDWVEAYDDEKVMATAAADGVEPKLEMILFIEEMRAAGRAVDPDFLVIPQNAPYLIDAAPDRYAAAIDGLAVEDTWFHGDGDAQWDDPRAGDLHERHEDEWSTANRLLEYQEYLSRGLPVFSVDYCISSANATQVYTDANAAGLRPLVTRVSLSQMTDTPPTTNTSLWLPQPGTSWQWHLSDQVIDQSVDVDMYDIDLFDTDMSTVSALHAQGRKVVCYISVGSWEDWRSDKDQFPASIIGNDYEGWPGEKWLDIREIDILTPIMEARLDECKAKGFDGVEPDNIDAYTNNTGFPLTYEDQLNYNIWLANAAHERGLSIGLKNNGDQVADLLQYYDWALTENCFLDDFCAQFSPFIQAGKAVFDAEYTENGATIDGFCPEANAMNIDAILKNMDLDAYRETCPNEDK